GDGSPQPHARRAAAAVLHAFLGKRRCREAREGTTRRDRQDGAREELINKPLLSGRQVAIGRPDAPRPVLKRGYTMKTMKQVTAAMIATFGVLAFEANAAAEQKFQKLTGAQIQAKFPGMELTDEAHWGEIFERNGTLTITSMGYKSAGSWLVQKDQLCLDTGKEPGGGCYEVWISGKNVELRNQASTVPLEAVLQKPAQGR